MVALAPKLFVKLLSVAACLLLIVSGTASGSPQAHGAESEPLSWTTNGYVGRMAIASTGTLYVTGSFTKIGARSSARVDRNGAAAVDTRSGFVQAWSPNPNGGIGGLAVSSRDNLVYTVGDFTRIGGKRRNRIAALDARSGRATGWTPERIGNYPQAAVGSAPDASRVYVAGGSGIGALDSRTGKLLWRSTVPYCCSSALAISADGRSVFATGIQKAEPGGSSHYVLVSLRARDGRMQWKFFGGIFNALLLSDDGRTLYLGGQFDEVRGVARQNLAALDSVTGRVKSWAPRTAGYVTLEEDEGVYTLALGERGRAVYVGGDFTSINRKRRNSLAAVSAESGRVLAWNPNTSPSIIETLAVSADRKTVYFPAWIPGKAPMRAIRSVRAAESG
jgi:PQQ-like domain